MFTGGHITSRRNQGPLFTSLKVVIISWNLLQLSANFLISDFIHQCLIFLSGRNMTTKCWTHNAITKMWRWRGFISRPCFIVALWQV